MDMWHDIDDDVDDRQRREALDRLRRPESDAVRESGESPSEPPADAEAR